MGGYGDVERRVRALLADGDSDQAVTETLRAHGPEVFGFLRGVLRNEADADEVFGALSERVWRHLAEFRWQCSLRTWVYVIARNEASRYARGVRRRNEGWVTTGALEDVIAAARTATRSQMGTEQQHKLLALRDELPQDDRTLLILRVDRDLSWDEIAWTFLPEGPASPQEETKRESARLRKRFQLVRRRLAERAREEGLLPR
jgi:RNA polymerase sigma-70 factor (ECF subfamily)